MDNLVLDFAKQKLYNTPDFISITYFEDDENPYKYSICTSLYNNIVYVFRSKDKEDFLSLHKGAIINDANFRQEYKNKHITGFNINKINFYFNWLFKHKLETLQPLTFTINLYDHRTGTEFDHKKPPIDFEPNENDLADSSYTFIYNTLHLKEDVAGDYDEVDKFKNSLTIYPYNLAPTVKSYLYNTTLWQKFTFSSFKIKVDPNQTYYFTQRLPNEYGNEIGQKDGFITIPSFTVTVSYVKDDDIYLDNFNARYETNIANIETEDVISFSPDNFNYDNEYAPGELSLSIIGKRPLKDLHNFWPYFYLRTNTPDKNSVKHGLFYYNYVNLAGNKFNFDDNHLISRISFFADLCYNIDNNDIKAYLDRIRKFVEENDKLGGIDDIETIPAVVQSSKYDDGILGNKQLKIYVRPREVL